MYNLVLPIITLLFSLNLFSQKNLQEGWWRAELKRSDGVIIPFNFEVKSAGGKKILFIRNAAERIKVDQLSFTEDSFFIQMPVFESRFSAKIRKDGSLQGVWIRGTSSRDQVMPFIAKPGIQDRFPSPARASNNISGRWAVNFVSSDSSDRLAVAEFKQLGNKLSGTFLTSTGDYRYLEGAVDRERIELSTFDGSHAYLFNARIESGRKITEGHYYSGVRFQQNWSAVKNADARLPENTSAVYLKEGEERLNFSFPDLDGKMVSIQDDRFRNKVVIVQIMGSWCPNCMDETRFLSDYYLKNRKRGIEVVSLAYEYSNDFERSQKSLLKFQQRFNVQYPMLITGAKTSDSLRTEKTLPQLTPIKMFPTTIFLGKDGRVRRIHTGFTGPGTGEHYEQFKKEFYSIVDGLLL